MGRHQTTYFTDLGCSIHRPLGVISQQRGQRHA
jgi:hypothetical protein